MNWAFATAGSLAFMGAAIHGIVGDRIGRRIDEQALPGNPFRGISTKLLIRVTWHFTTIAFTVLGVALSSISVAPRMSAATGIAYLAGAAFLSWSVFALVAGFTHGGMRVFTSHPAPTVFLLTVILIAWGATQL